MSNLFEQVERLPAVEKWQLVKMVLHSLENEQNALPALSDWHDFLRMTYGSLRDTPIQRWEQGEYEEREPLE